MSMKPQFNAVVSEKAQEKTSYTDIGVGWVQKGDEGINVRLIPQIATNKFTLFSAKDSSVSKIADRLNVCVVEESDGKSYWHVVGTAFYFDNSGHSGYNVVGKGGLTLSGILHLQIPKAKED